MKKLLLLLLLFFPISINALTDSSQGSIVMDINSGRILYQKNSNSSMLIASTSKLMTFLVTLEYASNKLDEEVIVGEEVLKTYGTNMYLSLDEKIKLKDLLYGLMLRSGNDASIEIALFVGGTIDNFVYLMNKKAEDLGMLNTSFQNPHGLDEETKNYSTAYDLAILTRYLYLNYPLYKEIAGSKYYDFKTNLKSYALINRSKIIFEYPYITSTKTGYTPKAGKSLVTTARSNNLNLIIVTLDNPNHYEEQKNMYDYFFKTYKNYPILAKNNFQVSNIFNTDYEIKNDFYYPLTKKEYQNITRKILVKQEESNILGSVQIILNDEIIHEEPIYKKTKENKTKENNLFSKIKKIFQNLINFFKQNKKK